MKITAQMFSAKGHYGPEVKASAGTLKDCTEALIRALEKLPEELEGVRQVDWTRITFEVKRT